MFTSASVNRLRGLYMSECFFYRHDSHYKIFVRQLWDPDKQYLARLGDHNLGENPLTECFIIEAVSVYRQRWELTLKFFLQLPFSVRINKWSADNMFVISFRAAERNFVDNRHQKGNIKLYTGGFSTGKLALLLDIQKKLVTRQILLCIEFTH